MSFPKDLLNLGAVEEFTPLQLLPRVESAEVVGCKSSTEITAQKDRTTASIKAPKKIALIEDPRPLILKLRFLRTRLPIDASDSQPVVLTQMVSKCSCHDPVSSSVHQKSKAIRYHSWQESRGRAQAPR